MNLYITSNPFAENGFFNGENDFLFNLSRDWPSGGACLLMSADPEAYENNDRIRDDFARALNAAGLYFSRFDVCDYRDVSFSERLGEYSAVFLSGGHVPTQNKFFTDIGLREKISSFNGLVLGISAGSMNCADEVYAIPELDGEAKSKKYKRFLKGLALTDISVVPHYAAALYVKVDGKQVIYDLALNDSRGKLFYGLPDGAYIVKRGGLTTLFGEAYVIKNGMIEKV